MKIIRELREKGVGITFEGEAVDTLTPGGDMLIAILAAQAEQESRNISKNVTWGFREKFRKGEIMLNCSRFLGYKRNDNGQIEIIEEEAKIVRRIYREFLNGYSSQQIAEGLTRDRVPTLTFKQPSEKLKAKGLEYKGWYSCTIRSILQNEKYKGSCLSLKTIKPELTGKRIKNDNQEQQYYLENSHPAIISKNTFELAQAEYARRQNLRSCGETGVGRYTSKYPLSGILVCNNCGSRYRRWAHYYKGEAIRMWTCMLHQKHADECDADAVKEQAIYDGYMNVLRELAGQSGTLAQILGESIEEAVLERQEADLEHCDAEIIGIQEEMLKLYREKNRLGQGVYQAKETEVAKRIEELNTQRLGLECKVQKSKLSKYRIEEMLAAITEMAAMAEFDEVIFRTITEKIVIMNKTKMFIYFKCGIQTEVELRKNEEI